MRPLSPQGRQAQHLGRLTRQEPIDYGLWGSGLGLWVQGLRLKYNGVFLQILVACFFRLVVQWGSGRWTTMYKNTLSLGAIVLEEEEKIKGSLVGLREEMENNPHEARPKGPSKAPSKILRHTTGPVPSSPTTRTKHGTMKP